MGITCLEPNRLGPTRPGPKCPLGRTGFGAKRSLFTYDGRTLRNPLTALRAPFLLVTFYQPIACYVGYWLVYAIENESWNPAYAFIWDDSQF